jgi:hypothetical protein
VTLLYTEITPALDGVGRCIFFAADRRISQIIAGRPRHYRKLVEIPYLNAALGFFGLAEFQAGSSCRKLADHLRDFVHRENGTGDLGTFARSLASALNVFVPADLCRQHRSGIHVAGINSRGLPEFWFVRNVDDAGEPTLGRYQAREEFLARDAGQFGFDGRDPETLPSVSIFYRNGDIVPHVRPWQLIDDAFGALLGTPGFHRIRTPQDHAEWIRFKMEILRHFHRRFQRTLLVGGKIDVLAVRGVDA